MKRIDELTENINICDDIINNLQTKYDKYIEAHQREIDRHEEKKLEYENQINIWIINKRYFEDEIKTITNENNIN